MELVISGTTVPMDTLEHNMSEYDKLSDKVDGLISTVGQLSAVVADVKGTMKDEILPAVRGIPVVVAKEIREHERECPLLGVVHQQTRENLTRKLRTNSSPPSKVSGAAKTRLIQAIAALVLALAGLLGGTQIHSCNQPMAMEVDDGN